MVNRIQPGRWLSESLGYGRGSLQVRGTPAGARYYLRTGGGRSRIPLGIAKGRECLTLDEARQRGRAISVAEGVPAAHQKTLGSLLTAYCETLAQTGSDSHTKTLALFHRHLREPHPQVWLQSAQSVTTEQIVTALDPLVAEGKLVTAKNLRASLNAAFNRAMKADLCTQSPAMRGFDLTHNPVALIQSISVCGRRPERTLTVNELRALWHGLCQLKKPAVAILRFYLLTGAQRLTQLLRVRKEDLRDGGIVLYDYKGGRSTPRRHFVPLIDAASEALTEIPGEGPFLLTLKPGHPPPHPATLFRHLQAVGSTLLEQKQIAEPFNFATLRRTVETQLAVVGIPRIVRAHLQSHGLDGIQECHYDCYSYLEEKQASLKTLLHLMSKS